MERNTRNIPNKVALIFLDSKISYRDLNNAANRFARALQDMGIGKGDHVALLMPNIPQFVMAAFGIWKIGAVAVPHSPLYTNTELVSQLNNSGCSAIVSLDLLADRVIQLRRETGVRSVVVTHLRDYLGFPKKQLVPLIAKDKHKEIGKGENIYEWMELQKRYPASDIGADVDVESLCLLMYTGGLRETRRNGFKDEIIL